MRTKLSKVEKSIAPAWVLRNYCKLCIWDSEFYARRIARLKLGDTNPVAVQTKIAELVECYSGNDNMTLLRLTTDYLMYLEPEKRDAEVAKCEQEFALAVSDYLETCTFK